MGNHTKFVSKYIQKDTFVWRKLNAHGSIITLLFSATNHLLAPCTTSLKAGPNVWLNIWDLCVQFGSYWLETIPHQSCFLIFVWWTAWYLLKKTNRYRENGTALQSDAVQIWNKTKYRIQIRKSSFCSAAHLRCENGKVSIRYVAECIKSGPKAKSGIVQLGPWRKHIFGQKALPFLKSQVC